MKKVIWIISSIILLAACGATNEEKTDEGYTTVDLADIEELQMQGGVVMDVREGDEFEAGHIIGAINMPLSQLQDGERAGLDKKQKYIVICHSGNRSKSASDILYNEGYDVTNVSEGMSTWQGEME